MPGGMTNCLSVIDRLRLEALEQDGDYRVIPSPGRGDNSANWVFDEVPRFAADPAAAAPATRGVA